LHEIAMLRQVTRGAAELIGEQLGAHHFRHWAATRVPGTHEQDSAHRQFIDLIPRHGSFTQYAATPPFRLDVRGYGIELGRTRVDSARNIGSFAQWHADQWE